MNLLPFDSVHECPKCGRQIVRPHVSYGVTKVMVIGERFIDIHLVGDPLTPHLRKNCEHCGYAWLEHPADAAAENTAESAKAPR